MAAIIFVRDGKGDQHAGRPHPVDIAIATEKMSSFHITHCKQIPIINDNEPYSKTSPWKHVVLRVEQGEENSKFHTSGYYLISGLQPGVCAEWFGIVIY